MVNAVRLSGEARKAAVRLITPGAEALDRLSVNQCMRDRCTMPLTHRVVIQITWRDDVVMWGLCIGHASTALQFWAGNCYYLQVEEWGVEQQQLPLDLA